MNRKIADRFDRAALYLNRVRLALQNNDPAQGMANAAELGFQAAQLYAEFRKVAALSKPTDMPVENS